MVKVYFWIGFPLSFSSVNEITAVMLSVIVVTGAAIFVGTAAAIIVTEVESELSPTKFLAWTLKLYYCPAVNEVAL